MPCSTFVALLVPVICQAGAASGTSDSPVARAPASVEQAEPVDQARDRAAEAEYSDIIVTGTRSAGRRALEAAVPVAVVTGDLLARTGAPNLTAQIQLLDPSVNYPRAATGASAAANRVLTLRGLNPDQTLVLVNGKRRHASSFLNINTAAGRGAATVDLSMIPDAAVERVEILKDGAAAQYGSDAIAGVINVILHHSGDGVAASLQAGVTEEGDGALLKGDVRAGMLLGDGGTVTLTLEGRHTGATRRVNVDTRVGYRTGHIGDPRQTALVGAVDLTYPVGAGTAYATGTLGVRDVRQQTFLFLPPVTPAALYPTVRVRVGDAEGVVGYRTPVADTLDLDVSNSFGVNAARFLDDTINPSLVSRPGGSPTRFFAGRTRYWQNVTDAVLSTTSSLLRHAHVAVGAQYRTEHFRVTQAEPAAVIGAGPLLGVLFSAPVRSDRDSYAAFIDAELSPVAGLDLGAAARYDHFADFGSASTWKATARYAVADWVAVRGSASTGFRAPSVQQNSYSTITAVQAQNALTATAVLPPASRIAQALGAGPLRAEKSRNLGAGIVLTPAPSLSFTADWYRILIDDRITLSDVLGGTNGGTFVAGVLAANAVTTFARAQFFGNFVDTRTSGIELAANYQTDLGPRDHIRASLAYATFDQKIRRIRQNTQPGGPQYILTGPGVVPTLFYVISGTQPEDKATLAANWDHDRLSVNLNVVRYGAFTYATGGAVQRAAAKGIVDIAATYRITGRIGLTAGVQNVGDVYPTPYLRTPFAVANFGGTIKYPEDSPFGFNGRSYYARLAYSF